MMKKKKQSRSQSSTKKTHEPSSDSSPSPRLISKIFHPKLSGKDLKHMFRGMKGNKTMPGLSSQSRIVRCPKCHQLLQEPLDATSYKCGGCDSILHAKRWELEDNDNANKIPKARLSSQNRGLNPNVESVEGGSRTPMRSTHQEYNSKASPTVKKHETSDIHREWMRRTDEFSVTRDSEVYASRRISPSNSRSNASQWKQHEGRYEDPPQIPSYPASPPSSSVYEYGYSSPFHGSCASASEQSYYHHQPNQFRQYGKEGLFKESSVASSTRFPSKTSDGKYYHLSSQSQLHDLQYHNLYESSSSATPQRSVFSERSYQAPYRSTYSEHSIETPKSNTSSEKMFLRSKNRYVRERNPNVKRHILPSAGGAPFATCSYCLELLQLPQVSPQGKHKRYQVRCGSCSGILKFSIREKADTVQDSPSFLDSGMFADETVTYHQDSASEGHEEIYRDGSHQRCLEDDFGEAIYKSPDAVIVSQCLETFEDKGVKEDIKNILQPHPKPSVNPRLMKQYDASNDTFAEISRINLEQLEEAYSEKSIEMDNNICERVGCNLEESEYEKNEVIKPEEVVGEGSGESSEVPVDKNERISESTREEAEGVAERPPSQRVERLYKKEYVCETLVLSEDNRSTHEFEWEKTQKNEEYGDGTTWEKEIMVDKPLLHLEKSQSIGDTICASSLSYGDTFEDTSVKENTEYISNTFSDAISATPQSPLKYLMNENQRFIEHPDQSGEGTITISRIYEEKSKHEYENSKERQELETTICDRVRYVLEESRYETNETLETSKVGEDRSVVFLEEAGEIGEERLVSHQMDSLNKNVEISYGTLEPVYLEGSGFAGERTWEETVENRAGLHLEDYESNYASYSRPFCRHDHELGTKLEPYVDTDGRLESSSRGSFNDNGSSEEGVVFHEYQDAIPEHSQYENESSSERQELSNTNFDIVKSDSHELRYDTNETLEPRKMVGDGSVVSVQEGETIISETDDQSLVSHKMEPENENMESYGTEEPLYLEGNKCESENPWAETMRYGEKLKLEECKSNPFEWTSKGVLRSHLHDYELETVAEPEEDGNGRPIHSSRDSFNDHETIKEIAVSHEEPWLVDENEIEEVKVAEMVEDGPSLHLEKCENESMKLEETHEWTSERAPLFSLHESELGEMLECGEDADGKSDSSSRSSFNDHGISKERELFNTEGHQLETDCRTEPLQVGAMTEDMESLHLEDCENESMKLDETCEWTFERSLTFRHHGCEVGTKHEPDKDIDGRSESSSRGSLNDTGKSKERAAIHEDGQWLVDDYENNGRKVSLMAEDETLLQLENCKTENTEWDETLEPRDDEILKQEMVKLIPRDKQENLRQTFKQSEAEEDVPAFTSRVSSESLEFPSKTAELESKGEEEILGDHLEKSGLTFQPYAHILSPTEPSEIVGLRHALYDTQSSPVHTPNGSPLHNLMASQIRSPITSPMNAHIVSPLRSPINFFGSISGILFLRKKA